MYIGFSLWLSGKESTCQCRRRKRHGFSHWVWKIPWSRKWQPTSIFPGKFYGQRSLASYKSIELQRVGRDWVCTQNVYYYSMGEFSIFLRFFFFFWYGPFLKSFLNLLQYFFYVLVFWLGGMWGLSSPTRDQTCTPCTGRRSPNHWTAGETPQNFNFVSNFTSKMIGLQEICKTQYVKP